jgi:hypothetical protein
MVRRQGPQLPNLMRHAAFAAGGIMRSEVADSHHGQGREQSRNRPDRFVHPTPPTPKDSPCAGGVHISWRKRHKLFNGAALSLSAWTA